VLHSDFHAARRKLGKLGIDTRSGGVKMISLRGRPQTKRQTNEAVDERGTLGFPGEMRKVFACIGLVYPLKVVTRGHGHGWSTSTGEFAKV
jgi:hypothetical protein